MSISLATVSFIFVVGLCVGSFLNVCIWRLPQGDQVIRGRSRCRSCRHEIPWYDNIPLLSFCLLKGKCRFCSTQISWSYPFVELATGALFLGLLARFGLSPLAAVYALLGAALILVSVIDWREMILPDAVTLPGISIGAVLSFYIPGLHGSAAGWPALFAAAIGALTGAAFLWAVGVVGALIFKREAMGQGDMKLMAMVGTVIGWQQILLVNLILAPVLGAVVGVILRLKRKQDLLPYGPFLALGTLISIFWGRELLDWYICLLGF